MKKNKKHRKIMLLVILLLGVTVGFALLSTTLFINGTANIKSNTWNIHWDDTSVNVTTGSVAAEEPEVSTTTSTKDTVSFDVEFEIPGDFYEFEIDAINEGSVDGALELGQNWITYKANGTETTLPSYMDFKVTYDDGTTVPSTGDVLAHGQSQTYKIRVEFKSGVEELPSNPQPITIEVNLPYVQHKEVNGPTKDIGEQTSSTGVIQNGTLGVLYFDPSDLTKKCNASNVTYPINKPSDTGSVNGCMKWYVINENSTTYTALLDHNVVAHGKWNLDTDFCSTTAYSRVKQLLNTASADWDNSLNPYILSANAVAGIVGINFDYTSATYDNYENGHIYFDSKNTTDAASGEGNSHYAWLYDYTANCKTNGCSYEDNAVYECDIQGSSCMTPMTGWWTSTAIIGIPPTSDQCDQSTLTQNPGAWGVTPAGRIYIDGTSNSTSKGIRPTVTVSKSIFK